MREMGPSFVTVAAQGFYSSRVMWGRFLGIFICIPKSATHLFFALKMSAADMIGCALFCVIVVFRLNGS